MELIVETTPEVAWASLPIPRQNQGKMPVHPNPPSAHGSLGMIPSKMAQPYLFSSVEDESDTLLGGPFTGGDHDDGGFARLLAPVAVGA